MVAIVALFEIPKVKLGAMLFAKEMKQQPIFDILMDSLVMLFIPMYVYSATIRPELIEVVDYPQTPSVKITLTSNASLTYKYSAECKANNGAGRVLDCGARQRSYRSSGSNPQPVRKTSQL